MYKVVMVPDSTKTSITMDSSIELFEADRRASLYSNRNKGAKFYVINEENGDLESQYP